MAAGERTPEQKIAATNSAAELEGLRIGFQIDGAWTPEIERMLIVRKVELMKLASKRGKR